MQTKCFAQSAGDNLNLFTLFYSYPIPNFRHSHLVTLCLSIILHLSDSFSRNSETVTYFWQNWNIPVHKWCLRWVIHTLHTEKEAQGITRRTNIIRKRNHLSVRELSVVINTAPAASFTLTYLAAGPNTVSLHYTKKVNKKLFKA